MDSTQPLPSPEDLTRRAGHSVKFGDVIAEIPGLSGGAGFLLYIENGILDVLEGYSYDEPWPTSTEGFTLRFLKGEERDSKFYQRYCKAMT